MRRKILHDLASIAGARQRELTARHLLLHPELVATASAADRAALREYIDRKGWRSLYGHDRRMYRLLRAGVGPCMAHLVPDFAANVKWTPDATAAGERMIRKVTEGKLDPRAHSRVFARLVTRERKRRGWTQNHLAKKAKLSIRTVYLFENNLETRITLAAALRLAEVLGLQFRVWYDGSVGLV